jgi:hypothetical protein
MQLSSVLGDCNEGSRVRGKEKDVAVETVLYVQLKLLLLTRKVEDVVNSCVSCFLQRNFKMQLKIFN